MVFRGITLSIIISWCVLFLVAPVQAITSEPDAAGTFGEPTDVVPQGTSAPVAEDAETLPSSVLNNRIAQPASAATTAPATVAQDASDISSTDAMVIIIAAVLLLGGAVVWLMAHHKKAA